MAAAITRHLFPNQIYTLAVTSGRARLNPFGSDCMEKSGIDISTHIPHSFREIEDNQFDLVCDLGRGKRPQGSGTGPATNADGR